MLHALNKDRWNTVEDCHLLKKMKEAKDDGRIRFAGFSFHDDLETFKKIVDSYDWDFCQIQFNYINLDYQAGMEGLRYAASKGLAVVIMEPLLGGKLAVPPVQVQKALPDTKTPVEWALDFLWNLPEVSLILSGMSTMQQTQDNLTYADRSHIGMLPWQSYHVQSVHIVCHVRLGWIFPKHLKPIIKRLQRGWISQKNYMQL